LCSLIIPQISYFSYRFDETTLLESMRVAFTVLLALDFLRLMSFKFEFVRSTCGLRRYSFKSISVALRGTLGQPRFLVLEFPAFALPLLVEMQPIHEGGAIVYQNCVAITQLVLFFKTFADAKAFSILERLVNLFAEGEHTTCILNAVTTDL
jgi:hypothetical protein